MGSARLPTEEGGRVIPGPGASLAATESHSVCKKTASGTGLRLLMSEISDVIKGM